MERLAEGSIEGPASWRAAVATLAILSVSFGAPLLVVVAMRQMQIEMGTDRSVPALASALVWIGNATGGLAMGWLADRIGVRRTTGIGLISIAAGLALSSTGSVWALYVGHGLLIGFLGNGALYAPLIVYVSRWFDRRRGTAIALVASGQYVAGILWPSLLEQGNARFGWQAVMLGYGAMVLLWLPLLIVLREPPAAAILPSGRPAGPVKGAKVLGLPPNATMALLCVAGFLCCVPMALPASHLVAFCGDIGIPASHGAAMLSVMLGSAFVSRQLWGAVADRFGGLRTILAGSLCQMLLLSAFLATKSEPWLFVVAASYGAGFSGLIPSYSVTIRDLFPAAEASWRIPTVLLMLMSGMAFGSWFGGALFDAFLSYRVAFAAGVAFNALNLVVIVFLVSRQPRNARARMAAASA
jgi:MFS family permease